MQKIILSIIIPVLNEANNIEAVVDAIDLLDLNESNKQVIIVDDGSTDGTIEKLKRMENSKSNYVIIYNDINTGKGSAIYKGLQYVVGEYVAIIDADKEVDISIIVEWMSLMRPGIDAIIGSREYQYIDNYLYYFGREVMTFVFKILFNSDVHDPLCGIKLLRREVIKSLVLLSHGFETDSEIMIRIIKGGYGYKCENVKYWPRKRINGKKIRPYHTIIILAFWITEALK